LLQLLAFTGHAGLVLRPLHPLAHLVHVRHHLLLFFLQPFEAPADFGPFLLAARLLQGALEFLEPVVQILLAAGQLLQTIEHLQLFPALARRGRLRLPLLFVTVLRLRQIHLVELALHRLACGIAPLAPVAPAGDLVLMLLHPEQRLVSRLFGRQGLGQRGR